MTEITAPITIQKTEITAPISYPKGDRGDKGDTGDPTGVIATADEVIEIADTSLLGVVVAGVMKKLTGISLLSQIRSWLDAVYEPSGTTGTHETTYSHDHTGLTNIGTTSHTQIDSVLAGLGTASTSATGDFEPAGTTGTHETTYRHDPTGIYTENAVGNTTGTLTLEPATYRVYSATATAAVTLAVDATGVPAGAKWTVILNITRAGAYSSGYPAAWLIVNGMGSFSTGETDLDRVIISGVGPSGDISIGILPVAVA